MMIYCNSSVAFICNVYIWRRLAPQIVIILMIHLLKVYVLRPDLDFSRSSVLQIMAGWEFQRHAATDEKARSPHSWVVNTLDPWARDPWFKSACCGRCALGQGTLFSFYVSQRGLEHFCSLIYHQLRARRALLQIKVVPLRTTRALSP